MNTRKLFLWVDIGLIVAIAISAVFLGLMMAQGPAKEKAPTATIANISMIDRTKVQIDFGNFSSPATFTQCRIEITSPYGDKNIADIENGFYSYAQDTPLHSLTYIRVSSTGTIGEGQYCTMENFRNLQVGTWSFKLIWKDTGSSLIERSVIVQDPSVPPKGSFLPAVIESPSEVRLALNNSNPMTELSYCSLTIAGPTAEYKGSFNITSYESTTYALTSDVSIVVVDANRDGLVTTNDYVKIIGVGTLHEGVWGVTLNYVYTGERIATAAFQIGG